jgi:carboxymethylenebutenolidase
MAVSAERLEVPTPDGASLDAELFGAAGEGPHPGVVVLHESFGLNDDIRRIAGRFAEAGYVALAPDLYSHGRRLVCLSRVMVDMLSGGVARETADIHATREALAKRPEVDSQRIAVAGFCQGGGFALVAGAQPGFSAAAVNYGAVPSDRSQLDGLCPVVASYGGKDRVVGQRMAERLEGHLGALGVPHDVKTYDRAGHSFFSQVDGWQGWLARMPSPMAVGYDEQAAEDGWRRMLGFFEEHVRGAAHAGPARDAEQ